MLNFEVIINSYEELKMKINAFGRTCEQCLEFIMKKIPQLHNRL